LPCTRWQRYALVPAQRTPRVHRAPPQARACTSARSSNWAMGPRGGGWKPRTVLAVPTHAQVLDTLAKAPPDGDRDVSEDLKNLFRATQVYCAARRRPPPPPPPPPRLSYLAHNSRSVDESADDLWLRGSSCRRRSRCLRACSTSTSSTRACSSPLSPLSLPAYVRMMRYASACAASARRRAQAATLEPSFRVTAMLYLLGLAGGPPPQAQCTTAPSASPRAFHPRPRPRPRPRQRRGPHPSTLPRHRRAPSGARRRTRRASGFRWQR
jgi:hypothetical protein